MSGAAPELQDAQVVDLFAGTGALGLEALSRGAESVVFVERSRASVRLIRENVTSLRADPYAKIVEEDVFRFLGRGGPWFDVAFADPPYDTGDAEALVARYLERPFARTLWLEHPSRTRIAFPPSARTRRYGDTTLTTLTPPDHDLIAPHEGTS